MRKNAAIVGVVVVAVVAVVWTARRDEDHEDPAESPVRYRAQRTAPAPRRPAMDDAVVAAPASGSLRLEGRVIGLEGQGVDGARVVLDQSSASATTTAADGRFSIERLEPRAYSVVASAGDLIAGPLRVVIVDPPRPLLLRLAKAASATVMVVDERNRPIAGAEVHARIGGWTSTVATDDSGTATLTALPQGNAALEADAPGYATGERWLWLGSAMRGEMTITLYRGSPVSGRVVDEAHEAIAGARITVGARTTPIVTGERGEFAIPALVRGLHMLRVVDDEHAALEFPVTVAGSPVGGIEIIMREGGVITGVVLDDHKRPSPLATITGMYGGGATWHATADQSGAFEVRGLRRKPAWLRAETENTASKTIGVDLTEHAQAEVELVVDGSAMIAGAVVDERGAPLPGVYVTAFPDLSHSFGVGYPTKSGEAITDGDGKFSFHGLSEVPYRLAARWQGPPRTYEFLRWQGVSVGDRDVQLRLVADGQLTGRLAIDRVDAPAGNIMISASPGPYSFTHQDGSFLITDIPPGHYSLQIGSPAHFPILDVEIRSGATTDVGTLTAPHTRMLVGRVVDTAGGPVGGAKVEVGVIRPERVEIDDPPAGFHAYRYAMAAPDGTFRVTVMPPAPMIVIASDPTYGTSPATPVPGVATAPDDPPPVTLVLGSGAPAQAPTSR